MIEQTIPDLFGWAASATPSVLREEERFGKWDARTGLELRNHYSSRISGERLAAYQRSFREERARYFAVKTEADRVRDATKVPLFFGTPA